MNTGDPLFSIIRTLLGNEVQNKLTSSVESKDANTFLFSTKWNREQTLVVAKYYLGIPNTEEYDIAYQLHNGEFLYFSEEARLFDFLNNNEGRLVLFKKKASSVIVFN